MIHLHDAESYELQNRQKAADDDNEEDVESREPNNIHDHAEARLLDGGRIGQSSSWRRSRRGSVSENAKTSIRSVSRRLSRLFFGRKQSSWRRGSRSHTFRNCCRNIWLMIFVMIVGTALFLPSYRSPPKEYADLRSQAKANHDDGRVNPRGLKVFLVSSLYDPSGRLLSGSWADNILALISLLGSDNVFLSIYENEGGQAAQTAMATFRQRVPCNHSIRYDADFSWGQMPHVNLPDGSSGVRRIAYLAELRNRAMAPLKNDSAMLPIFDRVVFFNDVFFDPISAAQLILLTNADEHGSPHYTAACAIDFINPLKFYDTFATRDSDGFSMGVPFFPWFGSAGSGTSRAAVLQQRPVVPVKSCWGGLVAFDARPFQSHPNLQFRSSDEMYWECSECCLIHADIRRTASETSLSTNETTGQQYDTFINPFVRVAYDSTTLKYIPWVQRVERFFSIFHRLVNIVARMPRNNPRQGSARGAEETISSWRPFSHGKPGGSFESMSHISQGDGFCGIRALQVMKETSGPREKSWISLPVEG